MINEAVKEIRAAEDEAARITAASKAEVSATLADAHMRGKALVADAQNEAHRARAEAAAAALAETEAKTAQAKADAESEASALLLRSGKKREEAVELIVGGILAQWQ